MKIRAIPAAIVVLALSFLSEPVVSAQSVISLQKKTNGVLATSAPGPIVAVGSTVTWTYTVTNNTGRGVTNLAVTDSQIGAVSCPQTTIGAGSSVTCTATGTATAGQYSNLGTATVRDATGATQTALDTSWYYGYVPNVLTLQKSTNGADADTAPGPIVPVGSTVSWTYVVTNTGSDTVSNLSVTDDQGVSVSCPLTTLAAGASMTCTASGTAQNGQYSNIGNVTGTLPNNDPVAASDPSHYFGSALTVQKLTDGFDANTAPGPSLVVGDPVHWSYVVTNSGPDTLTSVTVTDDQGVSVSCPSTSIAPGTSMTCTATGTVVAGQYANVGTVTAYNSRNVQLSASDPSYYYGATLTIQKSTDGFDAKTAPGPSLEVGNPVNWTYLVAYTGADTLSNVAVTDDQGVTVSCPSTTLGPGASMTCTASGTVVAGQYANIGSVTGTNSSNVQFSASDPSHYFGATLTIQKSTNGQDAKTAPGPYLVVGNPVNWTYLVTYTGVDTLSNVTVTDDQGVTVGCPSTTLGPGASMTCTASGTVVHGQYANIGTVTGTNSSKVQFSASDPSHYFGQSITEVPTMAVQGLVLLTLLLAGFGIWRLGSRF